ncbi:BTAD domain-containing putative transcriptional regulator [Nonomuraea sp. NPDC001023]|uniref:ATP-binding protein n=1 Tax=unclassified Nonomuraea TaxID=2593643 RepID=UPI00331FD68C
MRFGILGSTRAWDAAGVDVPLGGPARRALLALLLVRPGEIVSQDRLVDLLYGDRSPKNAQHALHSQVSRLRGDGIPVELTPAGYRLPVAPDDLDAGRFLHLADTGRAALLGHHPADRANAVRADTARADTDRADTDRADTDRADAGPAEIDRADAVLAGKLLREALALWRGPAFADLDPVHGAPLEERRLAALEDRIEADLRCGGHQGVIPELGELVQRHPLRERLRGQLMRALRADGRPAEALVLYEETRRLLAEELGADPSPELAALHRSLLRGATSPPPPPAPAPAPASRVVTGTAAVPLPGRLTSFVGRDGDLAEVRALLAAARLVTLLGPGGAGKSRLAVELARDHRDAVLVELAPLGPGADLARAVLAALGVRDGALLGAAALGASGEPDPLARLVAVLADRPALLVLDNCEHVVGEAAALAERLLSACPALRVLATSREPLAITPEHLWPVRPLTPSDARTLFTDRAKAVRPGFTPGEPVERICAALDGLPLAIELAAARMRTHEAAELAERLAGQGRFSLRGSRTADARHQTLRAVVAWSWELLTEPEQAMAMRLTVFSGGATAAAAAAVCGLPEHLLDSLADKSLLEVSGGRYRMLETIRAFCADRLGEEAATFRRAHAAYFLALAEEGDPRLRGAEQLPWLARFAADHDNLQAALRWTVEQGEVALGMRLLAAQTFSLWMRGMRTVPAKAAAALLEAAGPRPDPALGDAYLLTLLTAASGRRELWERHKDVAETMIAAGGLRNPVVTCLWPMVTSASVDPAVTIALIRRGERGPDAWETAATRLIWAYPRMAAGEFAAAEADLKAALQGFRGLGERWGSAMTLDALAWLASTCGDEATALARTEEAITLAEQLGAEEDLADHYCNRGDYRIRHDLAGARADYERAAELAGRTGGAILPAALRGLGDVAVREGDLARARELYEDALRRSDPVWVKTSGNMARLLVGLGRLAAAEGDTAGARASYLRAMESTVTSGALSESVRAIEALAVLAFDDDPAAAATLLGAAVAIRGIDVPEDEHVAGLSRRLREALGEQGYARARRAGARLSHREALMLAGVPAAVIDASPLHSIDDFPLHDSP